MTTQKLYLPSHSLYLTLHPLYLCHQTQGINCILPTLCMSLHTICVTSHSVCMTSHEHFMTSHPYRYDITSSIFMTSCPIYMISPILFHENKMTIPGISLTVFDITATASVWSHPLYPCLYNNYGSLHTWHTYDIIHTLHHTKFRLYDINRQYLGHRKHCIHDIRSPIHHIHGLWHLIPYTCDITAMISKHNTHYVCEYISTIFDMKHTVLTQYNDYIWHHTLHVYVCVITPTVSMIKYTLYLWHHIYCIYGTICTAYDTSPMIYDITTLYSWHQSYYISPHTNYSWQHIHCISVITPRLSIIQPPLYVW